MAPFAQAAFTVAELAGGSAANGSIWREVFGNYDFNTDQQTGQPQADIIGTATDPGFYTAYHTGASTGTPGDDFLAFRIRVNDRGPQAYNAIFLWVGIDADQDNTIDAYLNHTGSGSGHTISIYRPGTGANNSPSTSTMAAPVNTAAYTWTNPAYTSYRAVDFDGSIVPTNGPDGGTTNNAGSVAGTDGNTNADPDWYVSFQLPFLALINFLNDSAEMGVGNTIAGVNDTTPLRFIVASSTQASSFNQDIGGINGDDPTYNPNLTWDQQPGSPLSDPFTSVGVIPEPSSSLLVMLGAMALLVRRRRD